MSSKEESTSSRPYETPAQKAAKSVFLLTSFAVIIYASMRHSEVGKHVLAVFVIQWACFIVAAYFRTEKFYDMAGSSCFLYIAVASWQNGSKDRRAMLACGLVAAWALRLGTFLVYRIHKAGRDKRFDAAKQNLVLFFVYWNLQGLWVSITALQLLLLSSSSSSLPPSAALPPSVSAGLALWLLGFVLETTADVQKLIFRSEPQNADKFIQSGLWRYCRHPNYFGEMIMWGAVTLIAVGDGGLIGTDFYLACFSPLFVFYLLSFVSGVPILEWSAEKKWGASPEYHKYKQQSRVLLCLPWAAS
mmetsp:Transcript_58546/g.137545  ORF Transcript_58546/g.137545 Transcript_58546/m.137545 type:complete len:303 (+) Transcript_58546:176-1084(+)